MLQQEQQLQMLPISPSQLSTLCTKPRSSASWMMAMASS